MCGTFRGGAAKVCVFASGLLGTVGGSIVSNVLTAGTMTIPTMKKTGFTPSYSAAIEACASTGAVLAPPVLGATAFVMAQFMNVSYAEVALAATLPSVLYYVGLFMQVDAYAARNKLKGLQRAELPKLLGRVQGGLVLPVRDRDPRGHAAALQAREPRTVLRHRPARDPAPVVGARTVEARQHGGHRLFRADDSLDVLVRHQQRRAVGHVHSGGA